MKSLEISKDFRQNQRQRATESVTFMLSNTDKIATNDRGHDIQIRYDLQGSSFPESDVRSDVNGFYLSCVQKRTPVVALSFDGQFYYLMNCSRDNKPLTVFKLKKTAGTSLRTSTAIHL